MTLYRESYCRGERSNRTVYIQQNLIKANLSKGKDAKPRA